LKRRFGIEDTNFSWFLADGDSGYVGFDQDFRKKLERIHDKKSIECMQLRDAIKIQFPEIISKEEMRKTVE
jgi:hypothetical protein